LTGGEHGAVIEETLPPIPKSRLREVLLPRLRGQVFHVTKRPAARSIIADGEIRTNETKRYALAHGQSEASYFPQRGCVCLFDLRRATEEQIEQSLGKLHFLNPWNGLPVFFILDAERIPDLISSEGIGLPAMLVPHTEAGHKGNISLDLVKTILWVEVEDDTPEPEPGTWANVMWHAIREERGEERKRET
jgi:hypothetical protein